MHTRPPRTGTTKRFVLSAALAVVCAGCTSWEAAGPPRQVVETDRPAEVRVHYGDGRRVVLVEPFVRNDSIIGTGDLCAGPPTACAGEPATPIEGITSIEVRRVSFDKTVVAVVGSAAAAVVIGLLSWMNGSA